MCSRWYCNLIWHLRIRTGLHQKVLDVLIVECVRFWIMCFSSNKNKMILHHFQRWNRQVSSQNSADIVDILVGVGKKIGYRWCKAGVRTIRRISTLHTHQKIFTPIKSFAMLFSIAQSHAFFIHLLFTLSTFFNFSEKKERFVNQSRSPASHLLDPGSLSLSENHPSIFLIVPSHYGLAHFVI